MPVTAGSQFPPAPPALDEFISPGGCPSSEQLAQLAADTPFSQSQVRQHYVRFRLLGGGRDTVNVEALGAQIPSIAENPLLGLGVAAVSHGKKTMTFPQWLSFMSVFAWNAGDDVRTRFLFQIYDRDMDGRISPEDLRRTVSTLCQDSMTADETQQVVNATFAECDLDRDGYLSEAEFAAASEGCDLADRMKMVFPSFP
eukprot:TRINITY_DN44235_c0_g1_i1.p1 TRINITY_DN44235_c0_g1~~TRINITY_DN44235_c0_g1_i1.p1  ORF type:complete len:199 (+),score=51.41 TRINITY_DN44235_c0_g1_i1:68-664(+)